MSKQYHQGIINLRTWRYIATLSKWCVINGVINGSKEMQEKKRGIHVRKYSNNKTIGSRISKLTFNAWIMDDFFNSFTSSIYKSNDYRLIFIFPISSLHSCQNMSVVCKWVTQFSLPELIETVKNSCQRCVHLMFNIGL